MLTIDNLAVSPCSNPELSRDDALREYAALGYRKFEVFTGWAGSAFDVATGDPAEYLAAGRRHGMTFTSMHLPATEEDRPASVALAVKGAEAAAALGVKVVLYKGKTRAAYINNAKAFLDGIEGLAVIPVLQNHVGTPITTLEDFRAIIDGINDTRMKTLLEVGMFHTIGVTWDQGCNLLDDSIALVHIKDQIGEQRVPFGEGEVDLEGLFRRLETDGYDGEIVVEMEVCRDDTKRTLELLGAAREHIAGVLEEIHK